MSELGRAAVHPRTQSLEFVDRSNIELRSGMADARRRDNAPRDEVMLHRRHSEARLQLKTNQRKDVHEDLPRLLVILGFESLPHGDELRNEIAAGHRAACATLVFFDKE